MNIEVAMADGSAYTIRQLLTAEGDNVKFIKSGKANLGYLTVGLSLAAANESGYNVCPQSTPGCRASCIYDSGFAKIFKSVNTARIAKTRAWFQNRAAFKEMLLAELTRWRSKAGEKGLRLTCRLNVFSDIAWEKVWPKVFETFPDVQFYDYCKDVRRAMSPALPANYDLTFSRSELNHQECLLVLKNGGRVAVPFNDCKGDLPKAFHGFPVVDGDETDLRFLDPKGVWIGLYAKNHGMKDETGFVVPTEIKNRRRIALEICNESSGVDSKIKKSSIAKDARHNLRPKRSRLETANR